jgi:5-methylcytosine-specific restriction protein A
LCGLFQMDLLAYWRWDNYCADLDEGAGFNFNSNQRRLHTAIEVGERLWLVTGRPSPQGARYVLVGTLTVSAKTFNPPGYKYGRYRVWGNLASSAYYSADGPDATPLLLRLEFVPRSPIRSASKIGQSLQTIRSLSPGDSALLAQWAADLPLEPRAYQVADEMVLEQAYERGQEVLREALERYHAGVSPKRKHVLETTYLRNRSLVEALQEMYAGRCQLCGFDPRLLYGVTVCNAHHIVYLSRGGRDELDNLLLVCPNHHRVIHVANAVFDFKDLQYVFQNGHREPLVLNIHL